MNRLRRVINSTVISLIGQGVTWTSTLLLTIAYGRFLGDVAFGELFFATTFVLLLGTPIQSGYDQQLVRGVAQDPHKALRYFSNVFLIKIGLWVMLSGLILLISWLLNYTMEVRILIEICCFTLLSDAISSTFSSLHYALERVIFPVVGKILEKGLSALVGIILLRNGAGVEVMALVLLGGSLISGIWQGISFFRLSGIRFTIDRSLIRTLIRENFPFLIYGVLSVIYYRIDTVLLSLMTNDTIVGWYGASYRLFDTLGFLPYLLMAITFPIYTKLSATSDAGLKVAVEKTMNFLLFCALPIATATIVAAPNIIGFLYSRPEYAHAIPALQGLAPGLVFLYLNYPLGTAILSKRQDRKIPIMAAIALVFNLGLNLILIPMYQHVGAAIVTSLTELLLFCLAIVFVPKHLRPTGSVIIGIKATIASLIMAVAIWYLREYNIFIILLFATPIYVGAALLIRTIPSEDLRALYNAVQHKAQPKPPVLSAQLDDLAEQPTMVLAALLPTPRTGESFMRPANLSSRIALPASSQERRSGSLYFSFYPTDASSEDELDTTMTHPAVRLQVIRQHPSPSKEQIDPMSEAKTTTSLVADSNMSYEERLRKGYHFQLAGAYDAALHEYCLILCNAPDLLTEVISNTRALLKFAPKCVLGYRVLGDAYMQQKEYKQAMEVYNKMVSLAEEEYQQALKAYDKAMSLVKEYSNDRDNS